MPKGDIFDPGATSLRVQPEVEVMLVKKLDGTCCLKIDGNEIASANFDIYGPVGVSLLEIVADRLAKYFNTDLIFHTEQAPKSNDLN